MIRFAAVVALLSFVAVPLGASQASSAQSKPAPKAEEKATPALPGKWAMSIDTPQGSRQATMTVALDGKKMTGTIASDQGEAPLAGEFADNKLSFAITMSTGSGDIQIAFTGAFKEDGSLAGTLDYGQGAVNWTAQRMKEK